MLRQEISTLAKTPLQKSTLWEFVFVDRPDLKILCQSTPLPFISFETETSKTGSVHYTSVNYIEEVSLTFFETEDLAIMEFYKKWVDAIYDYRTRSFIRGNHHRDGILHIQRDIVNPLSIFPSLPFLVSIY